MKLSIENIMMINALEKISRADVKDCIIEGKRISYMVKEKEMGKAIGKKAVNVKELEKKLKKKVEIIGYYKKPEDVLEKTFKAKPSEVKTKGKKLVISLEPIDKKRILANMKKFKTVKELVKRNYGYEIILN